MEDRTSLLIVRAWMEEGSARRLRATIRLTNDVSVGIEREFTITDVHELCPEIEKWLHTLTAEGTMRPVDPSTTSTSR